MLLYSAIAFQYSKYICSSTLLLSLLIPKWKYGLDRLIHSMCGCMFQTHGWSFTSNRTARLPTTTRECSSPSLYPTPRWRNSSLRLSGSLHPVLPPVEEASCPPALAVIHQVGEGEDINLQYPVVLVLQWCKCNQWSLIALINYQTKEGTPNLGLQHRTS